jgi:DNA end-binding protein Ku
MQETERAAIARYAARGKQYIVMLRATDGAQGGVGIVMQTLLYGDEVRSISEVPIADAEVRENELTLAKQLVEQIASETFNPADYQDDVRARIQADIQRKVEGKEIASAEPVAEPARVIDLMEALKASLGGKARSTAMPDAGGIATRKPAVRATPAAKSPATATTPAKPEARRRASKR